MSIILDHINYCYSADSAYKVQALKDVSLEINDGEFIGIIGHTGSGKSTLIQHMNGLLKATSGHIYYNGQDIYDNDYDLSKLRHKVGMVFQYPEHQLFETDVITDVCFGPKNQGLSPEECRKRAEEALDHVGFPKEMYEKSPFELSGGQKRRVAIAGILVLNPKVLVLDEPTAGLDPQGAQEMMTLFMNLNKKEGKTVLLVTHDMEHVMNYCDHVIVLSHGEVTQEADVKEFFKHPEYLQEIGINPPSIVRLKMQLEENGFEMNPDIMDMNSLVDSIEKQVKKHE